MKRGARQVDPELESFLRFRAVARQLPDEVRARVLARSRAFLSASGPAYPSAYPSDERAISRPYAVGPRPMPTSSAQGHTLRRLAVAAAIAILAGAAGAVAALRTRAADAPPAAAPEGSGSFPIAVRQEPRLDPALDAELDAELDRAKAAPKAVVHHGLTSRPHPTPRTRDADPLAEVEILQHAHLAYARRDFRGALALVAEHARRFPNGPLAEECEALRVESLLAAGHTVEARRAGAAFAARFPRSVLLPGIEEKSHEQSAP